MCDIMQRLEDIGPKFENLLESLYQASQPLDQQIIQQLQELQLQTNQSPQMQQLLAQAQHLMATCQIQQACRPLSIQDQQPPCQLHVSPTSSYQPHPSVVKSYQSFINLSCPFQCQPLYISIHISTTIILCNSSIIITSTHLPTTRTSHITTTSPNTILTSTNSTSIICVTPSNSHQPNPFTYHVNSTSTYMPH